MKKLPNLLLTAIVAASTIVSCTKDDPATPDPINKPDPEPTTTELLTSKWVNEKIVLDYGDGQETVDQGDCPDKFYIDLKANSILEEGSIDEETCELSTYPGQWKENNKVLELTLSGEDKILLDIKSVTAAKLTLRINDMGEGYPESSYAEYTFIKK